MKYSKATRELAAQRCSALADYWMRRGSRPDAYEDFIDDWSVKMLSGYAYDRADEILDWNPEPVPSEQIATLWAEAEALIRTGWSPGA